MVRPRIPTTAVPCTPRNWVARPAIDSAAPALAVGRSRQRQDRLCPVTTSRTSTASPTARYTDRPSAFGRRQRSPRAGRGPGRRLWRARSRPHPDGEDHEIRGQDAPALRDHGQPAAGHRLNPSETVTQAKLHPLAARCSVTGTAISGSTGASPAAASPGRSPPTRAGPGSRPSPPMKPPPTTTAVRACRWAIHARSAACRDGAHGKDAGLIHARQRRPDRRGARG